MPDDRFQFRKQVDGRIRTWRFIHSEELHLTLLMCYGHSDQFLLEVTALIRKSPSLLTPVSKCVLVGAGNGKLGSNILRSLRHGVDSILCLEHRIDEAPTYRRVEDLSVTAESSFSFAHHDRGTRHTLHSPRDHQVGFTGLDRSCRAGDRVQAGPAQPIHRCPRNFDW